MRTNKTNYSMLMLNVQELLSKYRLKNDDAGNPYIYYYLDFFNRTERKKFISSIESYDDTALFYQLSKISDSRNRFIRLPSSELVDTALIYMDFGNLFNRIATEPEMDCRIRSLFRFGLHICYGDNTVTYVPFEKSNSMARNNKMTFIDSRLYDALNQRLLMDVSFDDMHVPLSKFYAYKGLYLSSGQRVEHEKLLFNSDTVIVIEDKRYIVPHQSIITAERKKDSQSWSLKEETDVSELIDKVFDGEGIISPAFSYYVNEALNLNAEATSFQIRMPFVKGMLHCVDFHKFLSEYAANADKPLYVKDIFGRKRDLWKAQIIMPESMFKWGKWLNNYLQQHHPDADPMAYYFEHFQKYSHALYVANTNVELGRKKYTTLNYQYLNTLRLTPAQLRALVNEHMEKANQPIEYLLNISTATFEEEEATEEATNEALFNKLPSWISLLKHDRKFAHEAKIKSELISISNSLKSDCGLGRLIVDGEVRFLSRDLLHFLTDLLYMIDSANDSTDNHETAKAINARQALYTDRFYMPQNNISLDINRHYAIFRSPHLARNEQCALRPYYSNNEDDIYSRYFSHLSGIIMVSYDSLDPQALGGADFDGDLVKIIKDAYVTDAVLKGTYQPLKGKQNRYTRKLPIIKIPSTSGITGNVKQCDNLFYTTIKNTFSSRVGQISNLAIRLGQVQYFSPEESLEHVCAECTILTGLEIDAAKSGVHPDLSDLIKYCKTLPHNFDYINDFKTPIQSLLSDSKYHFSAIEPEDTADGLVFKLKKYKSDKKDFIRYTYSEDGSTLATLPYYFFTNLSAYKPEVLEGEKEGGRYRYFSFMKEHNWSKNVDVELQKKISAVITAYNHVLNIAKSVSEFVNYNKAANFDSYVFHLIKVQYDDEAATTILEHTLYEIYEILEYTLPTYEAIFSALERLQNSNWPFLLDPQKPEVLAHIMNTDISHAIFHYADYLYNFDAQGYNILFYLLKDILSLKAAEASTEENAARFQNDYQPDFETIDSNVYNSCFKELFQTYKREASYQKTVSARNQLLLKMSCHRIQRILDEATSSKKEHLMTMYSIKGKADKNSSFFWNFFSAEELIPYISDEEALEC